MVQPTASVGAGAGRPLRLPRAPRRLRLTQGHGHALAEGRANERPVRREGGAGGSPGKSDPDVGPAPVAVDDVPPWLSGPRLLIGPRGLTPVGGPPRSVAGG